MGMGAIARATGKIAAAGLDMKIIGYDPYASDEAFAAIGASRCDSFEELLAGSDFLSLHCPLTDQTRGLLNAEAFSKMRDGAFVINTARGGLIDETALLDAVRSGKLAGAGLDPTLQPNSGIDSVIRVNRVMRRVINRVTSRVMRVIGG